MKIGDFIIYAFFICILLYGCNEETPEVEKALLDLITEPNGQNCSSGGLKIVSGIDLNHNNTLDASEIQTEKYVCNGNNSLMNVLAELSGQNCPAGGYKVTSGVDLNSNNILDTNEIKNIEYVCNGDNGSNSLINITPESVGSNCSSGGVKITSGSDLNRNNVLDPDEVQVTRYVCNGDDGYDKQINFKLFDGIPSPTGGSLETILKYSYGYGGIVKFNIDNFVNVDSAILIVYDLTARDSYNGTPVSGTMKIELYDCKNSQIIVDTEIISGEIVSGSYVYSKNFLKYLPHQDVELGVKMTKSSDFYAETKDVQLILYRK
jgi:hypothetical protein